MIDLPPLPKGYILAPRGSSWASGKPTLPVLWLSRACQWVEYGGMPGLLRHSDWKYSHWYDPTGGPFFAIPKPRYTCSLEFSRYV